ncbi:HD domain-containing protein [Candidatus Woesearchaeota archaeon]|nr:HD domain-containing protein [Candidatus Woesearchaeota archaeon]
MILGITGQYCSGKDCAGEILKQQGFVHISLSDFLRQEARTRGLPTTRENLILLGNELRRQHGHGILAMFALKGMSSSANYVITSIRNPGEVEVLRAQKNFALLKIDAPLSVRWERMQSRKDRPDNLRTYDEFVKREQEEAASEDPAHQQVSAVMAMADVVIVNTGTQDDLRLKLAQQNIVQKTKEFVRQKLEGEGSGHDWWHIVRVYNNAVRIAREEQVDLFVVQLGALLHDIADWKFHGGDDSVGPRIAQEWLKSQGVDDQVSKDVCHIVQHISFKGAGVQNTITSREGLVVQDADRLDALGAIGVARCFAYGGSKNRAMHDPECSPTMHQSFEDYKKSVGTSVNHFYEKLLLLKDRMNTATGKKLAQERHTFMEQYLSQFYREWEGE